MPLNINFQQIFLHMFNFVLLFGIAYFLLYSPIKKFMQKRQDYYKDLEKQAREKLDEAEAIKKDYEEKTGNCKEEILEMKEHASIEINAKREGIIAQAHKEADTIISNAKSKASREHDVMISDTKREIEAIVAEAEKKLINERSVSEEYETFLNAVEKKDN